MIRMTIIKAPASGTTAGPDMVFGPGGGTIGRSRGSTWVLVDTECLISRTHAEIYADNGQYFIADKSTNGLFLNQARKPLGFGQVAPLRSGDHLHLGHYVIAVAMESPQVSVAADDLGDADFLGVNTKDQSPGALLDAGAAGMQFNASQVFTAVADPASPRAPFVLPNADTIPDDWLRDASATPADSINSAAASWFENSLRMTLTPIVGSKLLDLPASDLITLIAQLARTATSTRQI